MHCIDTSLTAAVKGAYTAGRPEEAARLLSLYLESGKAEEPFARNYLLNRLEFLQQRTVLGSRPVRMIVSLTNRCILRCAMCASNSAASGATWDLPERAVDEIAALLPYLCSVHWMGGEIFLSKDFERLFDQAARNPFLKQGFATNGLLIDERWADRIAANNVEAVISIDGLSKGTYESVRRGAKFEDLLAALERLRRSRERARPSADRPGRSRVLMNYVVMKNNYRELSGVVDFAVAHGIEEVQLSKLRGEPSLVGGLALDDEAAAFIRELLPEMVRTGVEHGLKISDWLDLPRPRGGGETPRPREQAASAPRMPCISPWESLFITPEGTVMPASPCNRPVGSVREEPISAIWNGEGMQACRRDFLRSAPGCAQSQCDYPFEL